MTLTFDGINGYYLPYEKINKRILNQFFKNKKGILANAKYDVKALYLDGIKTCEISEDVVLLHHILNTQRRTNSIKSLAWLIGFGGYQNKLESYSLYIGQHRIRT
jgi:DNA polymerase I-like protein with 3'-5' exonuclease and polymerase domains